MKTVKERDLRKLIWKHYHHIFKQIPLLETDDQACTSIQVDVNSVCINVYDVHPFDSKADQEAFLHDFAKLVEDLTFGNLKVVDMGCEVNEDSYFTWLHIANAYEVIE